ncbi:MAG: bifunctional nuclease family protein [Acidobacteria bacterium]|nr:bifunctional nuclease family protein [Acidobacteriota bacterium]
MRQVVFLFVIWIVTAGVLPLSAQQPASAVEVKVDDLKATPYGISITLRASRSDELLHMLIGVSEGEAIARALSHLSPPRPMTHDLITTILGRTGWRVQKVLIRGISDSTFLADLVLEKNGETEVFDARPSDAMAIAVRSDAKIFVNPEVFEIERRQERQERDQKPKEETTPPAGGGVHL